MKRKLVKKKLLLCTRWHSWFYCSIVTAKEAVLVPDSRGGFNFVAFIFKFNYLLFICLLIYLFIYLLIYLLLPFSLDYITLQI